MELDDMVNVTATRSAFQRGHDHAASVEEPDRSRLYWKMYRHAEGVDEFAAGFCAEFRSQVDWS